MDPLGSEIRAELRRFGPQAGMAELVERWPEVVGVAIARNAWPARISRDGTVQVHTADSVWAFELGQRGRGDGGAAAGCGVRCPSPPLRTRAAPVGRGGTRRGTDRGLAAGRGACRVRSPPRSVTKSCAKVCKKRSVWAWRRGAAPGRSDTLPVPRKTRVLQAFPPLWRRPRQRPDTRPRTSPCSRASSPSGCGPACTSARPARAASITSSKRSSPTPSTRRSPATTTRSR